MPLPSAAATRTRRPTSDRIAVVALVAPFAVLVVLLAAAALSASWRPVHDFAFFELRVRDLGGGETPLLGPYSRYGWSHPGPFLFVLLAAPYRILLGSSNGLLVGAVLINGASITGVLLLARRRGGLGLLALTAIVLATLVHTMGGEFLISPWNPLVTILPLVLFLFLCWSLTTGDHVALPFTVAVGTFLVQTHVQYGLVVLAAAAWGLGWYLYGAARRRRDDRRAGPVAPGPAAGARGRARPWWIATGLVTGLLWLPPLLDQTTGSGNLSSIVRFFLTADEPGPGRRAALGIAGRELGPFGAWSTGDIPLQLFTGQVDPASWWQWFVPVVALAVAAVIAVRSRDRDTLHLLGVAAVAVAAATLSATRWVGPIWDYLVIWMGGIAAVVWLAVAWAILRPLARRTRPLLARLLPHPDRWRLIGGVAAAAVVAVLVATTPDLVGADPPEVERGELVDQLADEVLPALSDVEGPVRVRPVDTAASSFPAPSSRQLAAGLALALERDGTPVRVVDQDWELGPGSGGARMFDDHRARDGDAVGTLTVVSGRALDEYTPQPGATEIARVEDDAAAVRQARLEEDLAATFEEEGFPDAAATVPTDDLNLIIWTVPELAGYAPQIREILDLRETPRAAVWWRPEH